MRRNKWIFGLTSFILAATLIFGACAQQGASSPNTQTLTVYSGRSEELVGPIIEQFNSATGINVQVRYGSTSEMAATILEEGSNSPADIYYAQDPGGLGAVEHLLTPLPENILNKVEPRFRSPEGKWVGISGRARVVVYNPEKFSENDLPDDIWDFTDSKWRGRIGWAPTNGSFQAMVTAMRVLWGEQKTRDWINGIQANQPKVYPNNTTQVAAVAAGEIDIGFPNHYYLYRFLAEQGDSYPARNYHPRAGGPGAVILVSGAGIMETSKNKETAERFLDFMLSAVAQQYFAGQTYEYPVVEGVNTHWLLAPLAQINSPDIDMADLDDLKGTLDLLRATGIVP
ncbi:MAG: iron ABC transporter substrate-binding protein [Dehalococcoidales bacterium]|nr:iron ABC transporter substrate-binding protein [Dehalococcoidales bacterium]